MHQISETTHISSLYFGVIFLSFTIISSKKLILYHVSSLLLLFVCHFPARCDYHKLPPYSQARGVPVDLVFVVSGMKIPDKRQRYIILNFIHELAILRQDVRIGVLSSGSVQSQQSSRFV